MLEGFAPWSELYQLMASEFSTKAGLGPMYYKRFKLSDDEVAFLSQVAGAISEAHKILSERRRNEIT